MRILIVISAIFAAIAALLWPYLAQTPPEPEPLPPLLLQIPQVYWVEAQGTITVGDNTVPARMRVDYRVHPDQQVVISDFVLWVDDLDLVTPFPFWEAREPLRCTTYVNDGPITGTLENGELVIPAGAKVMGQAFLARKADGTCAGDGRSIHLESNEVLRIMHDPAGDHFALSALFSASYEENPVTVTLVAEGHYLNRPPIAAFTVTGTDVKLQPDGCPALKSLANTPEGLRVKLSSTSYDPDGNWPETLNPKRPRVDIAAEQWARSRPGGFSFLGAGQHIGPVTFETDREHQLLLWITDRNGAEGRKLCHFHVASP